PPHSELPGGGGHPGAARVARARRRSAPDARAGFVAGRSPGARRRRAGQPLHRDERGPQGLRGGDGPLPPGRLQAALADDLLTRRSRRTNGEVAENVSFSLRVLFVDLRVLRVEKPAARNVLIA